MLFTPYDRGVARWTQWYPYRIHPPLPTSLATSKHRMLSIARFANILFTICIGGNVFAQAQNPNGATFSPSSNPNGQINPPGQDNFSAQNQQLASTFTDYRTGQIYGRYIIYETVPVVKYQQKQVTEKQWVPEWVVEPKQVTQTTYVPVVTYQLQLQTERTINPFVQPRQYWQYVPIVQYQANHTPVMQQVTYQKYVEKEFTKVIPELVATTERVPRYKDMPLANQAPTTLAANNPTVPQVASTTPPVSPIPQLAMAAPPAYYIPPNSSAVAAQPSVPTTYPQASFAASPAYNPNLAGWNATNPLLAARSPNGTVATPSPYINNPQANAGLPQAQYVAAMPTNQQFQWPQFMTRTGSLFQGGFLRNNSASAYPNTNYSGTSYVASNSMFSGFQQAILPNTANNMSYTSPYTGATFVPNTYQNTGAVNGTGTWNVAPVNNFRDPTQTGIPASVLR